jgi:hypothetical protein
MDINVIKLLHKIQKVDNIAKAKAYTQKFRHAWKRDTFFRGKKNDKYRNCNNWQTAQFACSGDHSL